MKERRSYKGRVIEAWSFELKDGRGWDSAFFIEEHDSGGVTETQFHIPTVFPTQQEAIEAALAAGQQKIDLGFEHKHLVENRH
jgi:hypothetical protein